MNLNRITLTGRLEREPLLYDVGDHHVAALHLASEHHWRGPSGQLVRLPQQYRLTAWEELADLCGCLLHAGDLIFATGQLRFYTSWVGGIEHTVHEVVLDDLLLLAADAPAADQERAERLLFARRRTVFNPFTGQPEGPVFRSGSRLTFVRRWWEDAKEGDGAGDLDGTNRGRLQ